MTSCVDFNHAWWGGDDLGQQWSDFIDIAQLSISSHSRTAKPFSKMIADLNSAWWEEHAHEVFFAEEGGNGFFLGCNGSLWGFLSKNLI